MENRKIEDRNNIFEHKVAPIDKKKLWESIIEREDFPRNTNASHSKKIIKRSLLLLFILLMGAMLYFNMNSPKNTNTNKNNNNIYNNNSTQVTKSSSTTTTATLQSVDPSNQSVDSSNISSTIETSPYKETSSKANSYSDPIDSKNTIQNNVRHIAKQPSSNNTQNQLVHSVLLNDNESRNLPKTKVFQTIASIEKHKASIVNSENLITSRNNKQSDISYHTNSITQKYVSNKLFSPHYDSTHKTKNSAQQNLNIPLLNVLLLSKLATETRWSIPPLSKGIKILSTNRKKWLVSINYGIGMNYTNTLVHADEPIDTEWFYDHQVPVASNTYQLSLARFISRTWAIESGISFLDLYQKYELTQETKEYEQLSFTNAPYYTEKLVTQNATIYHHQRMMDLKLGILKKINAKYLTLLLKSGVNVNLSYDFNGVKIDKQFNKTKLSRELYKPLLRPSFYGGIALEKNVFNNFYLDIGLEAHSSRTATKNQTPVIQKFWLLKSYIGMGFKF